MYRIMIAVHCIGLIACICMLYILLSRKGRQVNSFIIMAIVFNCFMLIGYSFELLATSPEEMLISIQLGYIGKCFIGACFLTGIGRYYNWKYNKYSMPFLWGAALVGFAVTVTAKFHKLYYNSVELVWYKGHAFCKLGKAPFYYLFMCYILGLFLYFIYRCILYQRIVKAKTEKTVIRIVIVGSIFVACGVICSVAFSKYYDFCPLIFAIYSTLYLFCMLKYSLFDTVDAAIYQMAAENSQAILVTGEYGNLIYANEMAHQLFEWIDDKCMSEERIAEEIRLHFLSGQTEYKLADKEYQIAVSEVTDGLTVQGNTIMLIDVTQMKQHAAELELLSRKANEANRVKTHFLARMSHEIRTPINTILGMNEMILRESRSQEIREYAENIKDAGRGLLIIVNDILDLSKIEFGKMELINTDYEITAVVNDITNMIMVRADEKGVAFHVHVDENMPSVLYGDDIRIRQIILNLLTNAVKYTNEGEINLRFGGSCQENNSYLMHVEVEDTGIGIQQSDQRKLFNFFERLDQERTREIEGTGLGLNIVQQLLRMMGSDIRIESEYGKGSKFYFDLEQKIINKNPIGYSQEAENVRKYSFVARASFLAPEAHVLVVDDSRMNLEVFKGLLKDTGMEIDVAECGKEALEKMTEDKYDLIFMDHMMPEMDGIETYETLKRLWETSGDAVKTPRGTPVIVLTANAIAGARESYLKRGFTDYISKPIEYRTLERMILHYLPSQMIRYIENSPDAPIMTEQTQKSAVENIEEKFKNLEKYGIDLKQGIESMRGSWATYEEILYIYFQELPDKFAMLSCYQKQNDMKNYCIHVHSLKSTSKSVGATAMAELARCHEQESRQGNGEYVKQHFNELCLECENLLEAGMHFKDMGK